MYRFLLNSAAAFAFALPFVLGFAGSSHAEQTPRVSDNSIRGIEAQQDEREREDRQIRTENAAREAKWRTEDAAREAKWRKEILKEIRNSYGKDVAKEIIKEIDDAEDSMGMVREKSPGSTEDE